MHIIAAGQRTVTESDSLDLDPVEFDTVAGQDALRGIVADLELEVANDVDAEDLKHYRRLLGATIVALPRRSFQGSERGAA
ncbi:hypothetical protein ACIP4Q_39370 [Streptomyces massasporeus]